MLITYSLTPYNSKINDVPFVAVKHRTKKKQNEVYMNTGMALGKIQFARDAISG